MKSNKDKLKFLINKVIKIQLQNFKDKYIKALERASNDGVFWKHCREIEARYNIDVELMLAKKNQLLDDVERGDFNVDELFEVALLR